MDRDELTETRLLQLEAAVATAAVTTAAAMLVGANPQPSFLISRYVSVYETKAWLYELQSNNGSFLLTCLDSEAAAAW